ncbi:MAG: zinc-binding dehydrogenase [Solirubrobacterales bacterium]|nr:zinc-binding dehydrogenase [Solirubrobacterales bacterium]
MRSVVIPAHGSPDVLRVETRPDPTPATGEVLIGVAAAGVNFADTMARAGLYPDAPKTPCVVGYEVAGTVLDHGEGVDTSTLPLGSRVMAGTRFGGYSELVAVPVADAIPLPERFTFEQGAAIPVNYSTAWAGLLGYGSLRPGEHVLIHAAAGGVGIAATQIAKRSGAEIWGTASPSKHDAIRAQGVDHAVDYTRAGWEKDLPPMDLIMDAIGGESLRRSYNLLAPGGRVVAFGASSVLPGERKKLSKALPQALRMIRGFNLMDQMGDSKSVIGLNMLTLWDDRGTLEPWITPLLEMIEDGSINPVVSDTVPFDNAAEAHRILAERRNVGKVVLIP